MSNSTPPIPPSQCAQKSWCIHEWGYLDYIPSLTANAIYLSIFGLAFLTQGVLGILYRTWGYMLAMVVGTILEIVGYSGRLMLHHDVLVKDWFIIYLCGLTIGPALFSAALYLCLSRIIAIYGESLSLLKPRAITVVFICCDILSLALQAAGGAIASTADTDEEDDNGVDIMIAGLATQVAATSGFCCVALHLAWRIRQHPEEKNKGTTTFRKRWQFRLFLAAVSAAAVTILVRCTFRVAELSRGFDSEIANNEVLFMVFDGAMMVICTLALTLAHPGLMLGPMWEMGAFYWKKPDCNRAE